MAINLMITLIVFSVVLVILTTYFLSKGKIPEKYSLLWYLIALIILIVAIAPNIFYGITNLFGFEVMSNLIVGIMIGLLTLITMALTIICSTQRRKVNLLIQEISILNKEIKNIREKINN